MKKALLLLVAVLLVGAGGVFAFGGSILRAGVEKGGTDAFGTETRLESASLSILAGKVGLRGFQVANPEGFRSDRAIRVERVELDASVPSFLTDTVEIERVEIDSPEITIELGQGGTNVGRLLENLERHSSPGGGDAPEPEGGKPKPSKTLRVGLVRVTMPQVRIAQSVLGAASATISLPGFEMRDLGTGGEANRETTLPRLLREVLARVVTAALDSGAQIPAEIAELLRRETLASVAEQMGSELDHIGKELKRTGERLPQEVEDAAKSLQKLLPK